MKFLISLILIFSVTCFGYSVTNLDTGLSGVLTQSSSPSGYIGTTFVYQNTRYGVEIVAAPSGTVTNASAVIYFSNDGINFASATGAFEYGAGMSGAINGSGTYWLNVPDLTANYLRVIYSWTGTGSINIQEYRKVHVPLQ